MDNFKKAGALTNAQLVDRLFKPYDSEDLVDAALDFMERVEQNHRGNFQMVIVEIIDTDGFRRRYSLGDFGMEG